MGIETSDDAGVFKLNKETALIQTLDFLTPVTDSPYEFGQIAAANSLSDVYAMGGKPLTAMNIVCFSQKNLKKEILAETLQGGIDKINEAGAILMGGHSVDDQEFKYGLSITGIVHPDKVITNKGAQVGDVLILTKPIGTGIIATAIKAKLANKKDRKNIFKIMSDLNKKASKIMLKFNISSCTDITGFGLGGHVLEMAKGAKKNIVLYSEKVPIIENAKEFASMGFLPGGAFNNRKFCNPYLNINSGTDKILIDIMFDPQTSGGLIFSLSKNHGQTCLNLMKDNGINACLVGEIISNDAHGSLTIQ